MTLNIKSKNSNKLNKLAPIQSPSWPPISPMRENSRCHIIAYSQCLLVCLAFPTVAVKHCSVLTHGRKSSCNVISDINGFASRHSPEHPPRVKEKGRKIDSRHAPSWTYCRHTLLPFADTINFIVITVTKFSNLIDY